MNQNVSLRIKRFTPSPDKCLCPGKLAPDMVHIWWSLLDLCDENTASFAAVLNAAEKTRASRLVGVRRRRFIAAHGILRVLTGGYLDQRPESVRFSRDASGKPHLMDDAGPAEIHFSLSHSHQMGLFGFCPNRVIGVDIEQIRSNSRLDAIAGRMFTMSECTAFRESDPWSRPALFFQLWTMKEAWAKATGEGLRGLKGIEIPGCHAAADHGEWTYCEDRMKTSWLIRPVETLSGYAAAVAVAAGSAGQTPLI